MTFQKIEKRFGRVKFCRPFVFLIVAAATLCISRSATVSVYPEADTFLRSSNPTNNYGGAGAFSISGSAAVNATNQQNGLFDSLIRFPHSNIVVTLDASLGTHDWLITRVTLHLTEIAAPPSPIFNRGVGAFEVRWLATNAWTEGTGIPVTPTHDGITWNDLASLLNPVADVSLGVFTNGGVDGPLAFDLSLQPSFLSDIRAGTSSTLHLTAASPQIGFTADSRSFVLSNNFPVLEVSAEVNPHPRIDSIQVVGTQVAINFDTASNWAYVVQRSVGFSPSGANSWSNVFFVPAQTTNSHQIFTDTLTSAPSLYRLSLFP